MHRWRWQGLAVLTAGAIASCGQPAPPTAESATEVLPEAASTPASEPTAASEPSAALPPSEMILATVLSQVEGRDFCDGFYSPERAASASQVHRLGNQALVEVVCDTAAYQSVYAYIAYQSDGSLQPLPIDGFYPNESGQFIRTQEPTVAGLPTFDLQQQQLSIFSKGRGIGDCGSYGEYQWTGGELSLTRYRYRDCSNESVGEFIEPTDYPQVFP